MRKLAGRKCSESGRSEGLQPLRKTSALSPLCSIRESRRSLALLRGGGGRHKHAAAAAASAAAVGAAAARSLVLVDAQQLTRVVQLSITCPEQARPPTSQGTDICLPSAEADTSAHRCSSASR
eukprot:SAG25_NODE_213_length_11711_cov_8.330348_3_plen_123_part_00